VGLPRTRVQAEGNLIMGYAFNSKERQLDKRTLGGFFPSPIEIAPTSDSSQAVYESNLELGLPTYESDHTTSYVLEVDGDDAGIVRGRGSSWYYINRDGERSEKNYRSRKLASNALAEHFLG